MKVLFLSLLLTFAGTAVAEANEPTAGPAIQADEIPTTEREFVDTIHQFSKAKIIEQFGEPSKQQDMLLDGATKASASVWQYHYLNTAADGSYYQTTELDFVGDNVVMVVFMNNDGEEIPADALKVPVPETESDL